jgi:(2Fe-2S) ferredoxin
MAKRPCYIFLCMNERKPGHPKGCCTSRGSEAVRQRFAEVMARDGLRDQLRVVRTSCLDNCSHGPTLAVYPDDVWYRGVQPDDVEEIVRSHVQGGKPVARLVLPPGEFD